MAKCLGPLPEVVVGKVKGKTLRNYWLPVSDLPKNMWVEGKFVRLKGERRFKVRVEGMMETEAQGVRRLLPVQSGDDQAAGLSA